MTLPIPRRRRFAFRQENRLKRRSEFQETYSKGKCYRRKLVHVFVLIREKSELPTRIGFTATRKVGGSVVRNKLKRLGREVFRLALPELKPGFTMVVNFTLASTRADFAALRDQLHSVWREAGLLDIDSQIRPSDIGGKAGTAGEVDSKVND